MSDLSVKMRGGLWVGPAEDKAPSSSIRSVAKLDVALAPTFDAVPKFEALPKIDAPRAPASHAPRSLPASMASPRVSHGGLWAEREDFEIAHRDPRSVPPAVADYARDEIGEAELALTTSLQRWNAFAPPRDPSLVAASRTMLERLGDIGKVRDAIGALHIDSLESDYAFPFRADGPLADYVRGVVSWAQSVLRALEQLASEMHGMNPGWADFRRRLAEAEDFLLEDLEAEILAELAKVEPSRRAELSGHMKELFLCTAWLRRAIAQPFG